jgi:antitoxin PrlF
MSKAIPYHVFMIHSRITTKSQVTVPQAVRRALGLKPGDDLAWEIDGDSVIVTRAGARDMFIGNFSTFTEWDTEADRKAFRDL